MSERAVILGGGIAGLFSALLLGKQGYDVTILEKSNDVGGLLRSSAHFRNNAFFDHGTHLLQETGIAEIDALLYDELNAYRFRPTKAGAFKHNLYDKNGFIPDFHLAESDRRKFLSDLIQSEQRSSYQSLEEQLIACFGVGYYRSLVKDSVEKFYFTKAEKLAPDAHLLFGLSRIIVSDAEKTKELKKASSLDSRIAFHSYDEGVPGEWTLYPKQGGAGGWVNFLLNKLASRNVTVVTNCSITKILTDGGKVTQVCTSEAEFGVDQLVCTIPPFMLLNLLGISSTKSKPPKLLSSAIFHFVIDRNYLTDLHYLQCHDPRMATFRVTLYNNFSPRNDGCYLVTCEALLNTPQNFNDELTNKVFDELIEMTLIDPGARKLFSHTQLLVNGFPIPTQEFVQSSAEQNKLAQQSNNNIKIFGKSSGDKWFMNDIIKDVYHSLRANA